MSSFLFVLFGFLISMVVLVGVMCVSWLSMLLSCGECEMSGVVVECLSLVIFFLS